MYRAVYHAGARAVLQDATLDDCPYEAGHHMRRDWIIGWVSAHDADEAEALMLENAEIN